MNYVKVIYHTERTVKASELPFGVLRADNIDPILFTYSNTLGGVDNYIRKIFGT